MKMKYKITIARKPRGRWLPELTVKIWLEGENDLNTSVSFTFPRWRAVESCANLSGAPAPFRLSKENDRQNHCMSSSCYPCKTMCGEQAWHGSTSFSSYVECRAGSSPDYSDVVRWIEKNVIQPVLDEFNRRIAEAEGFGESEPLTVEGDSESFLAARQQQAAAPKLRKIKI